MGERLQEAMSECFEKKSLIKFEHVDIGHELEKRGMLEMWPTKVAHPCTIGLLDLNPKDNMSSVALLVRWVRALQRC